MARAVAGVAPYALDKAISLSTPDRCQHFVIRLASSHES
jgi:hypothetical protein